jgi:hypothetical protein
VGFLGGLQYVAVLLRRDTGHETVERDNVGSLHENGDTVHHKFEALAPLIRFAAKLKRAQASPNLGAIFGGFSAGERG